MKREKCDKCGERVEHRRQWGKQLLCARCHPAFRNKLVTKRA